MMLELHISCVVFVSCTSIIICRIIVSDTSIVVAIAGETWDPAMSREVTVFVFQIEGLNICSAAPRGRQYDNVDGRGSGRI